MQNVTGSGPYKSPAEMVPVIGSHVVELEVHLGPSRTSITSTTLRLPVPVAVIFKVSLTHERR